MLLLATRPINFASSPPVNSKIKSKTMKKITLISLFLISLTALSGSIIALSGCGGGKSNVNIANRYVSTNLIANKAEYNPTIAVTPDFTDAWGISIRPAGAGGHFWVTTSGSGKSYEYVGDVHDTTGFVPLYTDELKEITVPNAGGETGSPTGTVFNPSTNFVITQSHPNGNITAPAKFLFATTGGVVTGWTERKKSDGTFDRPLDSVIMWDKSSKGAQYFGIALSASGDRMYLANFGVNPKITTLDGNFREISAPFTNPFVGYGPFNIHSLGGHVFVTYAKMEKIGEEEQGPDKGRLVEYDEAGNTIAIWNDNHLLNAPWGIAKAPATGFGFYSGKLLVSNFGNGTITVFDPETREAIDYLRDSKGNPIVVEGVWEILFGNGVRLGDANSLYFAAGPNGEMDGVFGRITAQ
jgi:uncharacterized protein (TIGR03118 family)